MKNLIILTILISVNLSASTVPKYKHVVFIGIDGLGAHNLWRKEFEGVPSPSVPNINRLKENAAWTGNAQIDQRNWSGPNWVGMITGSTSDQHRVHSNSCRYSKKIPNIYQIIKEQIPTSKISVIYDWAKIKCHAGKGNVDNFLHLKTTSKITQSALDELTNHKPTLLFVYYGNVDEVGHRHGGFSNEYKKALEEVDAGVGEIIDYLKRSGLDKDTLIILTADHGHEPTSGNHSSVEFPVPLFLMGPGVVSGEITHEVRNNQVAAIVAYALGINPSPKWSSTIEDLDLYFSGN